MVIILVVIQQAFFYITEWTPVLGSTNLDETTGLQALRRKSGDKENLDQEGVVLATCRLTKRGDE